MDEHVKEYLREGEAVGARYVLGPVRRAPSGLNGVQLGRAVGSSMEFREYREYQPGDDLRRLDWGAYARSDQLMVRLYQQEVQPHLDLVLDSSRSMGLAGTDKARVAVGLASALATAAQRAGYSRAIWLTEEGCTQIPNGNQLPTLWKSFGLGSSVTPLDSFVRQPPRLRLRSVRVFVSDLLWKGDPMPLLSRLSAGAASVVVLQVQASRDVSPGEEGHCQLRDSETGEVRAVRLDARSVQLYREAYQRHMAIWHQATQKMGVTFVPLVAEQIVPDWRLEALVASGVVQLQ